MPINLCPCGSGDDYSVCCRPYHRHEKNPPTALALMRSRYCAYAKGLVDYIIATTHPENPHYQPDRNLWRRSLKNFSQNTLFQGLKIMEYTDGDDLATVTFAAYLKQNKQDVSFIEKSRFVKVQDKWLYLDGVVRPI